MAREECIPYPNRLSFLIWHIDWAFGVYSRGALLKGHLKILLDFIHNVSCRVDNFADTEEDSYKLYVK